MSSQPEWGDDANERAIPTVPQPRTHRNHGQERAYHPLISTTQPVAMPVTIARTVALDMLDTYAGTNIHDHSAVIEAASALGSALRTLLAALDAEQGEAR